MKEQISKPKDDAINSNENIFILEKIQLILKMNNKYDMETARVR